MKRQECIPVGCVPIGGSNGGRQGCAPPLGSKFFHFHAVFGKNLKNNSNFGSWPTPLGKILDPPLVPLACCPYLLACTAWGVYLWGDVPARGCTCWGGVPAGKCTCWGGYLPGGVPARGRGRTCLGGCT